VSDANQSWITRWTQLRGWRGAAGLPVVPPLGAMIELIVLMAIMIAIDWAFPALSFLTLEPSPFWLPVLLLSLQYGTVAGLLAAAAATAAYVFNGFAEQAIGENFFAYLLRIWALPILWIGVALVLGQFRLRQISEKQGLRQALAMRTHESQRLGGYATDLEERCQRLERQLTTRVSVPVKPVLDVLAEISGPTLDIATALDRISQRIWPGSRVSVFAYKASGCDVIGSSGWGEAASWATTLAPTHPLYRAIFNERRAVSIFNIGDEAVLAGQGMAAQPILAADSASVIGMLKIEVIDPAVFDQQTTSHLALMARLFSVVLSEPRAVEGTGQDSIVVARFVRKRKGMDGSLAQSVRLNQDVLEISSDARVVLPRRSS
jgi:polysaccharide biosynthesis protein PelD